VGKGRRRRDTVREVAKMLGVSLFEEGLDRGDLIVDDGRMVIYEGWRKE
jgi:hypothetical protein